MNTILIALVVIAAITCAVLGWLSAAAYRRDHAAMLRRLELAGEPSLEDRLRRAGHI